MRQNNIYNINKNMFKKSTVYSKKKYNVYQLKKGTKIEMEHSNNKKIAEKIAKDHLNENSNYYKKLDLRKSNSLEYLEN